MRKWSRAFTEFASRAEVSSFSTSMLLPAIGLILPLMWNCASLRPIEGQPNGLTSRSVIPNIDLPLRISPEAPNGEPVTLAPNNWRLVAAFDGSGTVRSLADRLGVSRFRVAKDLTALTRSGLIEAVTAPVETTPVAIARDEPVLADSGSTGFGWRESVEAAPMSAMFESEPPTYEAPQPDYAQIDFGQEDPAETVYNPFTSPEPATEPVLEDAHAQPEEVKESGPGRLLQPGMVDRA